MESQFFVSTTHTFVSLSMHYQRGVLLLLLVNCPEIPHLSEQLPSYCTVHGFLLRGWPTLVFRSYRKPIGGSSRSAAFLSLLSPSSLSSPLLSISSSSSSVSVSFSYSAARRPPFYFQLLSFSYLLSLLYFLFL